MVVRRIMEGFDNFDSKRLQRDAERQETIRKNVGDLSSPNPRARSEAAKRLGQLQAEPGSLLEALNDQNGFVRAAAAEALGHAAGEMRMEVIDHLLSAIDDSNDYVSSAAIRSLGFLNAESARSQIIAFLEVSNPHIVQSAILSLARLGPPDLAERLACFLDSDNKYLREAAAQAVWMLNYRAAVPKLLTNLQAGLPLKELDDIRLARGYIDALARLQERKAIPLLTEIAQNEVGLRSVAVQALIDLNAESASPILAPMLSDPSSNLRMRLIKLIVKSDYRKALPAIRPLLKDTASEIRQSALDVISQWKDLASVEQVRWMCYHDPNPYVRPQAISSLVNLLESESLQDLLSLANDQNTLVRRAVAAGLGKMNNLSPEAVVALNRLAADEQVAEIAQTALSSHYSTPTATLPLQPSPLFEPLIPEELHQDIPVLMAALERWQAALSTQLDSLTLDQIADIDAALTTLIVVLRRALLTKSVES
jgi:HEAT repeat protein